MGDDCGDGDGGVGVCLVVWVAIGWLEEGKDGEEEKIEGDQEHGDAVLYTRIRIGSLVIMIWDEGIGLGRQES